MIAATIARLPSPTSPVVGRAAVGLVEADLVRMPDLVPDLGADRLLRGKDQSRGPRRIGRSRGVPTARPVVGPLIVARAVAESTRPATHSTVGLAIRLIAADPAATIRGEGRLITGRSTMAADRGTSHTTAEAAVAGRLTTMAHSTVAGMVGDRATRAVMASHIMAGVRAITVAAPGTTATTAGMDTLTGTTDTAGLIMATAARGATRAAGRTTVVDMAGMTAAMLPTAAIAVRGKRSG